MGRGPSLAGASDACLTRIQVRELVRAAAGRDQDPVALEALLASVDPRDDEPPAVRTELDALGPRAGAQVDPLRPQDAFQLAGDFLVLAGQHPRCPLQDRDAHPE